MFLCKLVLFDSLKRSLSSLSCIDLLGNQTKRITGSTLILYYGIELPKQSKHYNRLLLQNALLVLKSIVTWLNCFQTRLHVLWACYGAPAMLAMTQLIMELKCILVLMLACHFFFKSNHLE